MAKSKIVKANEKIAEKVVGTFEKIESSVVGGYSKIEDAFVDRYLAKDSETTADAKERLKKEQEKRDEKEILHLAISLSNPFCLNSVLLLLTVTDKEALSEYLRISPAALISCCFLFLHSLVFSADGKFPHSLGASRHNSFRPPAGQFFPLPLRQHY